MPRIPLLIAGTVRRPLYCWRLACTQLQNQTVVVHLHHERLSPQICAQVLNCLHQPNELALIGSWVHLATEESDRPPPWCSTAPTPEPDASHSTKSQSKSGSWRTGTVINACCRAQNTVSSDQQKPTLRRNRVKGSASAP
jgi:hypothetical protein